MASNRLSRLIKIVTGTNTGAEEELLQLEGRLERAAHFWTLVARHFVRNRCLIRASALAYTTMLALIPLLVVIISISTSLLKNVNEETLYQAIASIAPPGPRTNNLPVINSNSPAGIVVNLTNSVDLTLVSTNAGSLSNTNAAGISAPADTTASSQKEIASWIHDLVQKTQGVQFGVTGMLVFVFIAIMMLSRIEETFNDIWGVARGRNWLTRVVLYWTAITLGPLLLLTALGLAGSAHFQAAKDYFQQVPLFGNFIFQLLPLMVLWLAFTLIYQIVPNTKVRFSAALFGGVMAGTLWHLNNVFGFLYVSRAVMNSQMYGKIGLVPVFMLGLYFSWVILLFGAQVAYAFQNRAAYLQDKLADNVNQRGREFVALRIMTLLGQRFQNGLRPASVIQLSTELGVPSRLTQQILRTLAAAHLVTEVGGAEAGYVPARPLDNINAHHVLLALRAGSGRELPLNNAPALAEIYGEFARIEEAERAAAEKISMFALVNRTPVSAALTAPESATPEKQISDALVVEEISRPKEVKAPEPLAQPEAEKPDLKPAVEILQEKKTARREVVMPEERDFPL
jgi:membrane protein